MNFDYVVKRPLTSIASPSVSPSLLNNSLKTPLAHPSLRDIAATTNTLNNPPDLFLQPSQKKRNVRNSKEKALNENVHDTEPVISPVAPASSKLITVFPSTSDELDLEEVEIEQAAGNLPNSDSFLFGASKIIPNLVLHENMDFSSLLQDSEAETEATEKETNGKDLETKLDIEPIIIEFKIEQ